jgi:hypothetical protein
MWAECDLFWIYSDRIYVDLVIEAPLLLFLIRLGRAGERCVSGARCQCTDVLRLEPQPQLRITPSISGAIPIQGVRAFAEGWRICPASLVARVPGTLLRPRLM